MGSSGRDEIDEVFDALDADLDRACALSFDVLNAQQQLAMLERCETLRRRIPAPEHPLINRLARDATRAELGGALSHAIAESTLTSRGEAARRIKEARDLGARNGLTGEPVPPVLAATAAAQRDGMLGTGQVAVIRKFYHQLPGWVDVWPHPRSESSCTPKIAALAPPAVPCPATTARCTTSPTTPRVTHRHRRPHRRVRPTSSPAATRRLDHPQKQPRRHRMEATAAPRARPVPHQHLPPPGKVVA